VTDYELRLFDVEMAAEVAELRRRTWGGSRELNEKYLAWKYDRNPYLPERVMGVALEGGRVVAIRGAMGTCWESDVPGSPHVLPCAADFIIDPVHRGRGLYEGLTAFVLEDLERRGHTHIVNLSAHSQNYVASVVVLGWRAVGRFGLLAYPAAPSPPTAASAAEAGGTTPAAFARWVRRRLSRTSAGSPFAAFDRAASGADGRIVATAEPRAEALAAVVRRLGHGGRLRHVRDAEYFAWRLGNPLSAYRFLYVGDQDQTGYLILQRGLAHPSTSILDWEATNADVRGELLDAALRLGSFESVRISSASLASAAVAQLHDAGFAPDEIAGHGDGARRFLVRPVGGVDEARWWLGSRRLDLPESWDLRLLFSDAF